MHLFQLDRLCLCTEHSIQRYFAFNLASTIGFQCLVRFIVFAFVCSIVIFLITQAGLNGGDFARIEFSARFDWEPKSFKLYSIKRQAYLDRGYQ
jgi:hypothetical protein